jgi:uncharacterized protein (DUF362 family)
MSADTTSRVAIVRREGPGGPLENSPVDRAVRKAVELIGGISSFVKPGDRVVVKPNLAYPYPPPATTDPSVVEAVARLCVEAGAREVLVGDSSSYSCKNILGYGKWSNMDVIRSTGMDKAAERAGAKVVDFDAEKWASVTIPGGVILGKTEIASPMLEADVVVNVPAMKTHLETLATLAIKNYHGIIPDRWKIQYHKDEISQKIVDIHKAVKTHLVVMDGLLGMEGLGPRMGSPVRMDLVLASSDTVAIDAVTSLVMGIEPDELETTRLALAQGIGTACLDSIRAVGLGIEEVKRPFRRPDVRISGIFPGLTVIQGGPCVHCYGRARVFLETLRAEGLLPSGVSSGAADRGSETHDAPAAAGISTLLVGVKPRNPDIDEIRGDAVFVGDCAIESSTNLRYALGKRALCLEGCPPIPSVHRVVDRLKEIHGRK